MYYDSIVSEEERIHAQFENSDFYFPELEKYVHRFSKKGKHLDSKAYQVRSVLDSCEIVCDSSQAFELYGANSNFLALLGYNILQEDKFYPYLPIITQMQAAFTNKGRAQDELADLKWERMLVKIFVDSAKRAGFSEVYLQPARNNIFFSERYCEKIGYDEPLEMYQKRMHIRYDVTAKRSGFEFDERTNLFKINL